MKQTAVEWLVEELEKQIEKSAKNELETNRSSDYRIGLRKAIDFCEQAKKMEIEQQGYSEEEVLPLLEMLQKCKEYFLLKTDLKNEERADAIGQVLENFKKK
jgi:hypothetical protein